MTIIENNTKIPLFAKNVGHFEFFTNEMECERVKQDFSNQVIVFNAIYFNRKMPGKRVTKNITVELLYSELLYNKALPIMNLFQTHNFFRFNFFVFDILIMNFHTMKRFFRCYS